MLRSCLVALAAVASLAAQARVCTVSSAGESCGPLLGVQLTPNLATGDHALDMVAVGLAPRSPGAFAWGTEPLSVELPGGCRLLCNQVWGGTFLTDAYGTACISRTWPKWVVGQFYMQMGSLELRPNGDFAIKTTNCKLVRCQ